MKYALLVGATLIIGVISALGQSVEPSRNGIDILHDLWVGLRQSGPIAMLLLIVLWQVDRERRQLLTERDKLLERVLTAMHATSDALKSIERIMHGGARDGER